MTVQVGLVYFDRNDTTLFEVKHPPHLTSDDYYQYMHCAVESCQRLGLDFVVLTDEETVLPDDWPRYRMSVDGTCVNMSSMLVPALWLGVQEGPCLVIDCDVLVLKDPAPFFDKIRGDLGLARYEPDSGKDHMVALGTIWAKKPKAAARFYWDLYTRLQNHPHRRFLPTNEVVGNTLLRESEKPHQVSNRRIVNGVRVHLLPEVEYNWRPPHDATIPPPAPAASLAHFVGAQRKSVLLRTWGAWR